MAIILEGCLSKQLEIKGKRKNISVSFGLHAFLFIFYVYNADIACRFRKGFRDHLLPTINKFEL